MTQSALIKSRPEPSLSQLLLKRLGFECWEYKITGNTEPMFYEIRNMETNKYIWASKHKDVFDSLALVKVLTYMGVDTLRINDLLD